MEKIHIQSVYFKNLKGLRDVKIEFEKPLTAIMGVNGAGKTTVIHALACIYRPDIGGQGEDHHFPDFFVPNTDARWRGSEFHVVNKVETANDVWETQSSCEYTKAFDRWKPRYASRPKRNVYYLGIDTCMPEIEKRNNSSFVQYTSRNRSDRISTKVLEVAAFVLNKDYSTLVDNLYNNHHFLGVITRSGLKYSSLSMGTGEQRTIKILEKVMNAEAYSLILIDEIDLLLHVSALRRLIKKLHDIAVSKHIQVVFTTHSLEVLQLEEYVGLQYINVVNKPDGADCFMMLKKPNDDIIRDLTGESTHPIKIYVEDEFSKAIIKSILKKHDICRKTSIIKFGAAQNAFSLAAGKVLSGDDLSNMLIVLDGDVQSTPEEKVEQIKKVVTGTEADIEEKRAQVLSCLNQYALPEGKSPEEFIFDLFMSVTYENEVTRVAREVHAVDNNHQLINYICVQLQESVESIMTRIIEMIECNDEWQAFILHIEEWVVAHKDL